MASTTTITAIIPNAVKAAQTVGAEPIGVLTAMSMDFSNANQQVAKAQKVSVPVAPAAGANKAFTPTLTPGASDDHTMAAVEVEITDSLYQDWVITDDQQRALESVEADKTFFEQMLAQKMRALRNGFEAKAALALKLGASRGFGTAGTTPCAADLNDIKAVRRILEQNGAPIAGRKLVVDGSLEDNILGLSVVQQAQMAGGAEQLRSGIIAQKFGFDISVSSQIAAHTAGTATGFDVNLTAGYVAGDTAIITDGCDSGTMLAGDLITWASDTSGPGGVASKYLVASATGSGAAVTLINFNKPGLRATLANTVEGTIVASYTPNFAFTTDAFVGILRPPVYQGSPMAQTALITDPITGMTYLLVHILGYGMSKWELHLAGGFKVVNPAHVALLIG